jgi:hypothetical protein
MAQRNPNEVALEALLSGDENRIRDFLSTHIVAVAGAFGNEIPSRSEGANCALELDFQTPGVANLNLEKEVEFKYVEPLELAEAISSVGSGGLLLPPPARASAFFFTPFKVNRATTNNPKGCNLDPYFQKNRLPAVNFPCIFLPPRLDNDVLVWTGGNHGALHISVLSPTMVQHGDDLGRDMHQMANSTFCQPGAKPSVWGPDDYRRRPGEKYVSGGQAQQDFCNVIGIWFNYTWNIYAQKTRPHKHHTRQGAWKVVEVWKLYPLNQATNEPTRLWTRPPS